MTDDFVHVSCVTRNNEVALVLREESDWLNEAHLLFEVERRIAADIGKSVLEVDAWLNAIRAELEA